MEHRHRWCLLSVALCAGLVALCGTALADPAIRPPIAAAGKAQSFMLVLPQERT